MGIIYQKDNRSGITYAYQNEAYWDKAKKMSRAKRTLIGRVVDGEIVPTDGRCKKDKKPKGQCRQETRHMFYGATYLLDRIAESIGLKTDLRICFPEIYDQILSIAYYMIMEDSSPLYRFEKWHLTHWHPYGMDITSPRSSELFSYITDENISSFFKRQWNRRTEEEYWAYDSTSISTYSRSLVQAEFGKNKENDLLPQINLLLVFGEKSGLPFYYRKLSGKIPDCKTVKHLLEDLQILGFNKAKMVMDRGFYSEKNINDLYKDHVKFLIGCRMNLRFIQ